jgi:ATP-dependent exoDNAse (exonuclease V) alpha subunit
MELHTRAKVISRNKENPSKSRTCCGSAAYRAGEKIIGADGRRHDYTRKGGVIASGIMTPEGAPEWMKDRQKIWQTIDTIEKRKDAQLFREFEMAIPNEFDERMATAAVQGFIKSNFVDNGMVADWSIHDPKYKDGHRNQHAHIMLALREISEDGFGKKNRDWNDMALAAQWRENWADMCNYVLERFNIDGVVEHKSYAERGIDRIPQEYIGLEAMQMERRGIETEGGKRLRKIAYLNSILEKNQERAERMRQNKYELDKLMEKAEDFRELNSVQYKAAVICRDVNRGLKLNAKAKNELKPIAQAYNTISMLSGEHDLKDFERERLKEAYSVIRRAGYDPTNPEHASEVQKKMEQIRNSNRELSQSREKAMNVKIQAQERRQERYNER